MAYNLPPPWDPGYALPDNVRDEGLEKRGFVTKQMPRGWYDDPSVGTGGYAVPEYVMDEGYGQGTFTTKWEPRGEYDGPALPPWLNFRPKIAGEKRLSARAEQIDFKAPIMVQPFDQGTAVAMSGTDVPPLFQQYGSRAASAVIGQVTRLPKHQRSTALKTILGKIDPTLWPRTEQLGKQYMARGLSAGKALHAALSQSMARGVINEAVKTGRSRVAPQARSLLGLGCYGQQALGAITVGINASNLTVSTPTEGSCSADGKYRWTSGAWARLKAGEVCTGPAVAGGPTLQTGPSGGVQVLNDVLSVGPGLEFPAQSARGATVTFTSPANLSTPELREWIRAAWTTDTQNGGMLTWSPAQTFMGINLDQYVLPWLNAVGITYGTTVNFGRVLGFTGLPAYRTTHPLDGKEWGVFIRLTSVDGRYLFVKPQTPPVYLQVALQQPKEHGLFARVLSIVSKITKPAAVYGGGVLSGALSLVADIGCQLVNNPNAVAAGGAAGGPAGAAGMAIAQQTICQPDAIVVPPPPPPAPSSNLLTYALIGGGALAAIAILTNKKKTA